jgi:hypothetical protein
VEKSCRALQATDNNTIRRLRFAFWIIKFTIIHSEYNNCFFSTATIVTPTRLNITLYLHCLSYRNYKRENERNSFDFIIRTRSIALDGPLFFFQNIFRSFFNFSFPTQCLTSKYFRSGNKTQPLQFWSSCLSVTPGFSSQESVR